MPMVPMVVEQSSRGDPSTSTRSCSRSGSSSSARAVDDDIANLIVAQLIHLESEDPDKDISLYINSPGGSVTAGLAIYDTMQYVKPDDSTICFGIAMSMEFAAALREGCGQAPRAAQRCASSSTSPQGGFQGQATDIEIHAREAIATRERVDRIYAKHTGKSEEQVHDDMDRDRFFSAEEAAASA